MADHDDRRRRLAAILSADVAGYSRLMGADEDATITALNQCRAIFRDRIEAHRGRVVDTAGDSILAVFDSVVEAVQCATEVQGELSARDRDLPDDRRMAFRIGVNSGDVIEQDDGTIYGDGVNIAARLESLAEPGEVMISGMAQQAIRGKLDLGFADIGEHDVKNIAEPVRAYRVLGDGSDETSAPATRFLPGGRMALLAAAAGVAFIVAGVAVWQTTKPTLETVAKPKYPVLALPTGPSIAVLPFDNLSGDPEQEYFSDGITEDIISGLTRFDGISVISRSSTSAYKNKDVDIRELGRDLGVDFVVEGSVRRTSDTLRITAQLIDAKSGSHLWAETFDQGATVEDLFATQDEITSRIVSTIGDAYGVVARSVMATSTRKAPKHLKSYECVLLCYKYYEILDDLLHIRCRKCTENTLKIDPEYVDALAWSAQIHLDAYAFGFTSSLASKELLDTGFKLANQAVLLDQQNQRARWTLANALFFRHELDAFFVAAEKTVQLNPNNAAAIGEMAQYIAWAGRWDRGVALSDRVIALNPDYPAWIHFTYFWNFYRLKQYQAALEEIIKGHIAEFFWTYAHQAAVLGQLGRMAEAKVAVENLLRTNPTIAETICGELTKFNLADDLIGDYVEGLRKAGLDTQCESNSTD